jgi:hypothetical protein
VRLIGKDFEQLSFPQALLNMSREVAAPDLALYAQDRRAK